MNNNEMISVPRELLERCVVPNEDVWIEHTNRAGDVFINALDELESLLAETPASIVAEKPAPAAVVPDDVLREATKAMLSVFLGGPFDHREPCDLELKAARALLDKIKELNQ